MTLWEPLGQWLREHPSEDGAVLNDGASEEALAEFERSLDVSLPQGFRDAWREHDGETPGDRTLVRMHHLLPLAAIASEWRTMNECLDAGGAGGPENVCDAGPGVREMYWNPRWIPFVLLGGATDFHCLDLDPAEGGRAGQVIHVSDDLVTRSLVAPDLATYFAHLGSMLRGDPTPTPPPPPRALSVPPPFALGAFVLRVALAAGFWVCVWHAVSTHHPAWIAGSVGLWVVYFIARRRAVEHGPPA